MNFTDNLREIYFAGGCFWGVEAYFSRVEGVLSTNVGYANGRGENPSYEEVCAGGQNFAETVFLRYEPNIVSLSALAERFFSIIDPVSVNRQGKDTGVQYRTGVYYRDEADLPPLREIFARVQSRYDQPLAVELLPLANYFPAEEYHQRYLVKNPNGYCHIDLSSFD